ncbi:MAG: LPS export ABC transporter periplasmic protein LptC [Pseudomonadota bacterium]
MRAWIAAVALLALGVGSFWLWQALDEDEAVEIDLSGHDPDYFIEKMTRRVTGVGGELRSILRADLVTHYPDDDSTELESPHLEIYNGRPKPWHVIAERGWVASGNDVVLLHGEVEIWKNDDGGTRMYQVLTSELRVLPHEKYAETDNPATIIGPSSITHSVGMRANFARDRLELLERVRSRYEVEPQG